MGGPDASSAKNMAKKKNAVNQEIHLFYIYEFIDFIYIFYF